MGSGSGSDRMSAEGRHSSKGNSDEIEDKILHSAVVRQQSEAQKGCGISVCGDAQNLTGHGREQSELALKPAVFWSAFEDRFCSSEIALN